MQPDPVDTTNALLIQLIQTLGGSTSAVQPITLSAPTGYSSAYVWAQALAYASLAFSLLAAFGAVLGKQWLGYYKTNCYGRGSLEARCKQRHRKFQKLQNWRFENVLHLFPVLIEISLLLFSLSLGAAMWTQHQAISILIIATAGLGVLCHIFTIMISAISSDFPFQTTVSLAIRATFRYIHKCGGLRSSVSLAIRAMIRHFREDGGSQPSDNDPTTSAMRWILETSTNPDVVKPVVEFMRTMVEQPKVNIVSLCKEVGDMFKTCFDLHGSVHQDRALAYGQALMHFSCNNDEARRMLRQFEWDLWKSWRALYLPCALKQCFSLYKRMEKEDTGVQKYTQADLRNALRMTVTIGVDGFTDPSDEQLIWDDHFRLHSFESDKDKQQFIHQLLAYAEHFYKIKDFEAAGDALLIASGITSTPFSTPGLFSNSTVASNVIDTIKSLPSTTTIDRRWGCVVLGVVRRFLNCDAYSDFHFNASQAVLTALGSPGDRTQCADDQYGLWFDDAIQLFKLTDWPEDHHLRQFPLSKFQDLVLFALRRLPTPKVDDAAIYIPYCRALRRLMDADHPELRHSALHIASNNRQELALIDVAEFHRSQQNMALRELSPVLLTAAVNNLTPMTEYFRLISTLARNPKWRRQLTEDGHDKRCTALITADLCEEACFYLAQFFLWIPPPTQDISCGTITPEQQWLLTKAAWHFIGKSGTQIDDAVDIIPTLVKSTEILMPQYLSKDGLKLFRDCMGNVVQRLQHEQRSPTIISEVTRLKDVVEDRAE